MHTSAVPAGFPDCRVPGVEWVATDVQRAIIEELRTRQSATARELAAATDVSKRHVAKTLARLLEDDRVSCRAGVGDYGADVYTDEDVAESRPEQNLKAALAEGRIEDEGWRVRRDGSQFWANVTITAIRDAERDDRTR